jgi:type I restriction enzyme S subunit
VGAVQQHFNVASARRIHIALPELREQRAIVHVLGALDDKIDLNRRMNETLESTARSIFKSWFVDFDPVRAKAEGRQPFGMNAENAAVFPRSFEDSPLGKIPKGWNACQVSQLAELSRNTLNPGEYPNEIFDHYSLPAFDDGHWPAEETGIQIKSNKTIVPVGAVLLSKLNPRIPRIWMPSVSTSRRSIASTEFLVANPKNGASREYIFCLFSCQVFMDVFETFVTGTSGSHQRVRPESLLAIGAAIAPPQILERFTKLVAPLLSKGAANVAESRILASIRNTLLPKLISGEIRVKAS